MEQLIGRTQIRVAFHPLPQHDLICGAWNVRVEMGPLGYMTVDGQKHAI